MIRAVLFDDTGAHALDDWTRAVASLTDDQVLWLDVLDPDGEDEDAVADGLGISRQSLVHDDAQPALDLRGPYLRVAARAAPEESDGPWQPIVALAGESWAVTAHAAESSALERFRAIADGEGEVGRLDAASFVADALEWVVGTYARAFDRVEERLETADEQALARPHRDIERAVSHLVEARREVGTLRRSLAPHREVFAALTHPEFDLVSTPESARRYAELTGRVDAALAVAGDAREAIVGSFDMLVLRTEHRTNEIVKVLTLASILLLPGSLLAGLAGMNVDLPVSDFLGSGLFWFVLALVVALALTTLGLARARRWI